MNRAPILFRCDGTPETGWEPLYQCQTLAAALQRRRRGTYFLSQLSPGTIAGPLARGGNEWAPADHPIGSPEDADATAREVRRLQADAVVVAASNLTAGYLRELASTGAMVAVLGPDAGARFPCRLVVNPLLGPGLGAYSWERGTQLLLGKRYALVRSVFRRQRPLRAMEPPQPFRALLAFGDDDFQGQALLRAQELLTLTRVEKISVAVRSHHKQIAELQGLAREYAGRLEVLTEPSELSTRIPRSHFALTSGDGWSLEIACVGIPQLVLSQRECHVANAQLLDEEGAATYLGRADEVSNADLRGAIQNLLSDQLERACMARRGRQLIDGRGPDRLVNALEILLAPARPAREMRLAA